MLSTQRGADLSRPPFPTTLDPSHLQSGTTMGLSLTPRNSPRSFSAASTAFLASNLGRPWRERPHHGHAQVPPTSRQAPVQTSSPGKAGAR